VSEKLEILEMLRKGTITVDEASELLEAAQERSPQPVDAEIGAPPAVPLDMQRFRHLSYIPFGVCLLLLALITWGTVALARRIDGQITFGFVVLLILLVLLGLCTILAFLMTRAPWLHVRVRSKSQEGSSKKHRGFAISLPVPFALAQWALRIGQRYVSEEQGPQLDLAASILRSVKHDVGKPGSDPIVVDVDDEDERVQVYIG
jgi:hypothetical protein